MKFWALFIYFTGMIFCSTWAMNEAWDEKILEEKRSYFLSIKRKIANAGNVVNYEAIIQDLNPEEFKKLSFDEKYELIWGLDCRVGEEKLRNSPYFNGNNSEKDLKTQETPPQDSTPFQFSLPQLVSLGMGTGATLGFHHWKGEDVRKKTRSLLRWMEQKIRDASQETDKELFSESSFVKYGSLTLTWGVDGIVGGVVYGLCLFLARLFS